MLSRDPTPEDRAWLVAMQVATPTDAAISLLRSAVLADYSQTARERTGVLPVANVVRDDWMTQARPWLVANAPSSAIWAIPSHMGFWEEHDKFNESLVAFVAEA